MTIEVPSASFLLCFIFQYLTSSMIDGGMLSCNPPTYTPPLEGLHFLKKTRRQKYPRLEIGKLIRQNRSLWEVKLMRRRASIQKRLNELNDRSSLYSYADTKITRTCDMNRKHVILKQILKENSEEECWVLRNWWNYRISWVECNKFCKAVPHKLPFHLYTCVPSTPEFFQFWIYCRDNRSFHKKTIRLPKYCVCEKYTCYQIPMLIPVPVYETG